METEEMYVEVLRRNPKKALDFIVEKFSDQLAGPHGVNFYTRFIGYASKAKIDLQPVRDRLMPIVGAERIEESVRQQMAAMVESGEMADIIEKASRSKRHEYEERLAYAKSVYQKHKPSVFKRIVPSDTERAIKRAPHLRGGQVVHHKSLRMERTKPLLRLLRRRRRERNRMGSPFVALYLVKQTEGFVSRTRFRMCTHVIASRKRYR
jgi:hypothetical protein